MTVYSVTGSSASLSFEEVQFIKQVILELENAAVLITGAAYGVDSAAFRAGLMTDIPLHRLLVPAAPHNASLLLSGDPRVEIIKMRRDRTDADSYMIRNDELVRLADVLLAFPRTEREGRSGTWATIRRARKADIPVRLFPLDKAKEVAHAA